MSESNALSPTNYWQHYPDTYRSEEVKTVVDWLAAGESGVIVGLSGAGRASLLSFLHHRPDVLHRLLSAYNCRGVLVPVDLINLPDNSLATLYRTILRSFYEVSYRFDSAQQTVIHDLYRKTETSRDAFLSQSALRELLLAMETEAYRIGLIFDRFDRFCETATVRMTNTLRGLRDSFKETLCYLVSLPQELIYSPYWESLEPLRGILDSHTCWVGPLLEKDARHMIAHRTQHLGEPLSDEVFEYILAVTGGYPSLIRVVCDWWVEAKETAVSPTSSKWETRLLPQQNVQHRLGQIWYGLTQEEQSALSELQKWQGSQDAGSSTKHLRSKSTPPLAARYRNLLPRLHSKGVCYQNRQNEWQVNGRLLASYIAEASGRSRGKIWLDTITENIYQGDVPIENLPPLERAVLGFLIQNPYARHTHTDLIEAAWPEDVHKEGVSTDALYQTIRGLRKKIEPQPSAPCYILNWRGQMEGGYHFFPEGRPAQ